MQAGHVCLSSRLGQSLCLNMTSCDSQKLQNKLKRYLIRMLPRPDRSDPVRYHELARLVRLHEMFPSLSYPLSIVTNVLNSSLEIKETSCAQSDSSFKKADFTIHHFCP